MMMMKGPHKLVDGKVLALMMIATGQMHVCGRDFQEADVKALDSYMHRCKLGAFRVGRAVKLASAAASPNNSEAQKQQAVFALNELRVAARKEFAKLRQIQRNRFMRCWQEMVGAQDVRKDDLCAMPLGTVPNNALKEVQG